MGRNRYDDSRTISGSKLRISIVISGNYAADDYYFTTVTINVKYDTPTPATIHSPSYYLDLPPSTSYRIHAANQ